MRNAITISIAEFDRLARICQRGGLQQLPLTYPGSMASCPRGGRDALQGNMPLYDQELGGQI